MEEEDTAKKAPFNLESLRLDNEGAHGVQTGVVGNGNTSDAPSSIRQDKPTEVTQVSILTSSMTTFPSPSQNQRPTPTSATSSPTSNYSNRTTASSSSATTRTTTFFSRAISTIRSSSLSTFSSATPSSNTDRIINLETSESEDASEEDAIDAPASPTKFTCMLFPTIAYLEEPSSLDLKLNLAKTKEWAFWIRGCVYRERSAGSRRRALVMTMMKRFLNEPNSSTVNESAAIQNEDVSLQNGSINEGSRDVQRHPQLQPISFDQFSLRTEPSEMEPAAATPPSSVAVDKEALIEERLSLFTTTSKKDIKVTIKLLGPAIASEKSTASSVTATFLTNASGHFSGFIRVSADQVAKWQTQAISSLSDEINSSQQYRFIRFTATSPEGIFEDTEAVAEVIEPEGISVISDIDDTIKESDVHLGARAALKNAFTKEAKEVEGIALIYHFYYHQGAQFHYVSASPTQLYPTLSKFLKKTEFPPGSIHLRNLSLSEFTSRNFWQSSGKYKLRVLRDMMTVLPKRKFILVGDAGQQDMEVYSELARLFPNNVLKIFIRNVHLISYRRNGSVNQGEEDFAEDTNNGADKSYLSSMKSSLVSFGSSAAFSFSRWRSGNGSDSLNADSITASRQTTSAITETGNSTTTTSTQEQYETITFDSDGSSRGRSVMTTKTTTTSANSTSPTRTRSTSPKRKHIATATKANTVFEGLPKPLWKLFEDPQELMDDALVQALRKKTSS